MGVRLKLAALLAPLALATAVGVDRAGACSCAAVDPRDWLAAGRTAVIGEVTAGRRVETPSEGPVQEYTLRVERGFNASLAPVISIRTGSNQGSCGFTLEVGDRVAAFLSRRDGAWNTSLCALTDPAELVAATVPYPRARGQGRVALLSGGSFASARLMALDQRGRVLAYGFGRGDVERISVCPGSRYAVELVRQGARSRAAVRDLRSMRVVRSLALPASAVELSCGDRRGRAIHAAALGYSGAYPRGRLRVLRAAPGRTVAVATLGGDAVAFGRTTAYVGGERGVSAVDLATGGVRALTRLKNADELALSPDGTRLAVNGTRRGVRLVDSAGGRLLARVRGGRPAWVGRSRLLVRGSGRPRLYDRNLRPLRRLDGFWALGEARSGRRVFGVSGRRLVAVGLKSGRRRQVAVLPDPDTHTLVAIPGSPALRAPRRAPSYRTARRPDRLRLGHTGSLTSPEALWVKARQTARAGPLASAYGWRQPRPSWGWRPAC